MEWMTVLGLVLLVGLLVVGFAALLIEGDRSFQHGEWFTGYMILNLAGDVFKFLMVAVATLLEELRK